MKNKTFIISIGIILAVFITLLCLGSCDNRSGNANDDGKGSSVSSNLQQPFTAKATITTRDFTLEADMSKTAPGCATLTVVSPPSLKNMQFQYDGKDITASYMGMSVKLDADSKLSAGLLKLLINAVDKASERNGVAIQEKGGIVTISGNISSSESGKSSKTDDNSGKFIITMDKKSGTIGKISLPGLDAECRLADFKTE